MNENIVEKIEKYNKKIELLEKNKTKLETELEMLKNNSIEKKKEILKATGTETIEEAKEKIVILKQKIKSEEDEISEKIDKFFEKYNELVG